jgi:hypothetical protein
LRAAVRDIADELQPGAYLVGASVDVVTMPYSSLCEQLRAVVRDVVAPR